MFHMQPEIGGVTTTDWNFARAGLNLQTAPLTSSCTRTEQFAQALQLVLSNRQTVRENPLAGIFATI
jgi:hypothetical protein